ncbi:putative acyl-CoA dehydrogenase FadE17 [Ylistrum balloti]|uniref:putative acyl-CoA dehydrogenase FadE17 n=1 Tax=Ylistrum balloti TaxID=509963 RepID=UPI002905C544|nr:putative acyl-CoA dehydrogenase FadE17 [Ylistrum balloti]
MANLDLFRKDLQAWLKANVPQSLYGTRKGRFDGFWGGRLHPEPEADVKRWFEVSLEKGFTAPTWPTMYGGGGLTHDEAEILEQELERLKVPPPLVGFGLVMIGPTLLDYGTETQKKEHLPKIVSGETRWCQGYSEPGAGSDLAGLQTTAEIDGDKVIINGQKVWTSHADKSDWIFCLTRTDKTVKKQAGITFILVDMLQDAISVRPIPLISGSSPFCEVFLDNATANVNNIVGQVNSGWQVAKALLGYERTTIGKSIGTQLTGTEMKLVEATRTYQNTPQGPLKDPFLRCDIVNYAIDEMCYGLTTERIQQTLAAGAAPGPESSILKLCGSELKQRRFDLATRIAGPQALGWEGPGFTDEEQATTRDWLRSRASTIEGGSSEIQLNIIAKRVLGLPSV